MTISGCAHNTPEPFSDSLRRYTLRSVGRTAHFPVLVCAPAPPAHACSLGAGLRQQVRPASLSFQAFYPQALRGSRGCCPNREALSRPARRGLADGASQRGRMD